MDQRQTLGVLVSRRETLGVLGGVGRLDPNSPAGSFSSASGVGSARSRPEKGDGEGGGGAEIPKSGMWRPAAAAAGTARACLWSPDVVLDFLCDLPWEGARRRARPRARMRRWLPRGRG